MDSAYLYHQAGMTMLTALTDQNQISTLAISYPVVDMETSLGLTPPGQTLCLLQSPELCNACTQDVLIRKPPVFGDSSLTAPILSPSKFLTLPLAPSLEQTENNNMDEMTAEPLLPMKAYE
ncbi:hypothetical protein H671_6g15703, partial [Cricetulus griseus]